MAKQDTIVVGQSVRRIDAVGKVTGEAPYPGDFDMDGQLYMKIRFSDRAHARITAVDASAAEALSLLVRQESQQAPDDHGSSHDRHGDQEDELQSAILVQRRIAGKPEHTAEERHQPEQSPQPDPAIYQNRGHCERPTTLLASDKRCLDDVSADRTGPDAEKPRSSKVWTAPASGSTVHFWAVLRDSRGGMDFGEWKATVAGKMR